MSTCVVDACALAALLYCEPQADEVADRLDGMVLVAPPLFWCEMTSIALQKIRRQPQNKEKILEATSLLQQLDIQCVQVDSAEVVRFAERYEMPINNAHYVWLATTLGAQLITLKPSMAKSLASVCSGKTRHLQIISTRVVKDAI